MINKTKAELNEMLQVAKQIRDHADKQDRAACNLLISVINFWDKQTEESQEAAISCIEFEGCTESDIRELRG